MYKNYALRIKSDKHLIARNIILAICIFAILALVICIVAALGNRSYMDILWYSIMFIAVVAVQYSTTFLTYELIICYENGVIRVKKRYYKKTKLLLEFDCNDSKISSCDKKTVAENSSALTVKSCAFPIYVVELSGKTYLLNLDDYMYSLIEASVR